MSVEVWLRDELKKWSSHLLDNISHCLIHAPEIFFLRCTYETIAEIVQQVWGSFLQLYFYTITSTSRPCTLVYTAQVWIKKQTMKGLLHNVVSRCCQDLKWGNFIRCSADHGTNMLSTTVFPHSGNHIIDFSELLCHCRRCIFYSKFALFHDVRWRADDGKQGKIENARAEWAKRARRARSVGRANFIVFVH